MRLRTYTTTALINELKAQLAPSRKDPVDRWANGLLCVMAIPFLMTHAIILPQQFCLEFLHLTFSWGKSPIISQAGTLPSSCLHRQGRVFSSQDAWKLSGSWLGRSVVQSGRLLGTCPPGSLFVFIFIILNDNAVSTREGSLNSQMVTGFFCQSSVFI